jgi:hypothetical protein
MEWIIMDIKLDLSKVEIHGKQTWKAVAHHHGREFVGYGHTSDDAIHDLMEQNVGEFILPE